MSLLKHGRLVGEDAFQPVADDAALPASGAVLVTYARWQVEREQLTGRNAPLGILLPNNLDVLDFGAEAERFDLIVLQFPKFSDGRAYSQARLLRERFGYRGELRATGHVLQDQLWHMQRSGFDAFEIPRADAVEAFAKASRTFSHVYQPTGDGRVSVLKQRLAAHNNKNGRSQEAAE
ncbi:DUF934 domain-containing protein [Ferrovibrio sp.]|uniref:DUF934 domain-containing protein n=1 Tax=Ferrovibrio sp. TaxID=1917215 RepID=UPI000CBFBA02|nr:DUF934 domain-containing protein [Ferrovibrio sp.]PJI39491.1 MAG: oxidoreductase [Ferrovibrio sp.]